MATLTKTRILRFIAKKLGFKHKMTLWTNSQCVFDWLKQNEVVFVRYPVDGIIKEDDVTLPLQDNPTNSQNNNNRFEDESVVVAWT